MTIAPHSGIVDFGTFTPPNAPQDGIQGEVPAPLVGQETYVLTATGWAPGGGGGGSVTAVTASSPLASSGGATPNIDFGGLTGTAGQYLQSTGTASPTWATVSSGVGTTAYYGAFQDNFNQTISSTTVAYYVKLRTTDSANGVSIVNDALGDPTKITFANSGVYSTTFSIQFGNSATQEEIADVWLAKNGTNVPESNTEITIHKKQGGVDGSTVMTVNFFNEINAGDYLQLVWRASNTGVYMAAFPADTSPTRPDTPSIILTTTQITQIGIGYYNLTSTTSNTIGAGSKTFTTNLNATNTAFTVGTRVRIAYQTTPSNFMEGVITAFSGTSMTVNVDSIGGSGTYDLWTVSVAGIQGSNGVTSIAGTSGQINASASTGSVTLSLDSQITFRGQVDQLRLGAFT